MSSTFGVFGHQHTVAQDAAAPKGNSLWPAPTVPTTCSKDSIKSRIEASETCSPLCSFADLHSAHNACCAARC